MKRLLLSICLVGHVLSAAGQIKHDHVWLFGFPPNARADSLGGTMLDFNAQPRTVTPWEAPFGMGQSGVLCDADGHLVLYTNGCDVRDRHHEVMQGGEVINGGQIHPLYCGSDDGTYPLHQGVIALPHPDYPNRYALFHLRVDDFAFTIDRLLHTVVDVDPVTGQGTVVQRDVVVWEDPFSDMLTAVRHANGRDWWVVVPARLGNRQYTFLFSPTGVVGPLVQDVGHEWAIDTRRGQACFSPDGSKYARIDRFGYLSLLDFDRCTGVFAERDLVVFQEHTVYWGGVSFSSNSRFLYSSYENQIIRFDCEAPNLLASVQWVGNHDGGFSPNSTTFYQHALGPDGKIYITSANAVNRLHVIHRPNEPTEDFDFEARAIRLEGQHAFAAPNIPHFRLWDVQGSPCDTLGIDTPVSAQGPSAPPVGVRLFPNPTTGPVTVLLEGVPAGAASLRVYGIQGQLVWQSTWPQAGRHTLDLGVLPAGVYYAHVTLADGRRHTLPLVKR